MVACLEDAIGDGEVAGADRIDQPASAPMPGPNPLVFVRVREPDQIERIATGLADRNDLLTGFVLPKFTDHAGADSLEAVRAAGDRIGRPLLAMPILESAGSCLRRDRIPALMDIRALVEKFADVVLAVRLGATDLAATYGLRRSRDHTVYDIQLLAP